MGKGLSSNTDNDPIVNQVKAMNKLITADFKLLLICVALQLIYVSPGEAQSNNSLNLGSKDRAAYIDITKLPTRRKIDSFEHKDTFTLLDAKRSASSFYSKWNWDWDKCSAGTLREGVIAYCLPCVGVGRPISDPNNQIERFVSLGPVGIFAWYETDTDSFFLWNAAWNFDVLGPFVGHPQLALNQAIKPRQGERNFPDVSLSVVSQRWMYPDERQARVPRDRAYYDCSRSAPCGKAIEQQNLSTFITRFRLVNDSERIIYYLGNFSDDNPIGYTLPEFVTRTDCDRSLNRYHALMRLPITWKPLLPGASVEFELKEIGWQVKSNSTVYW